MPISTHAPAGGATPACSAISTFAPSRFLLTPLREGRRSSSPARQAQIYFYSRPCGRGDAGSRQMTVIFQLISTHAPAGGATFAADTCALQLFPISTHAPAGGATASCAAGKGRGTDFYSRPCGRGDRPIRAITACPAYFYSRPCGRGDFLAASAEIMLPDFYSRPCGRGDRDTTRYRTGSINFYSRPCGRGDRSSHGSPKQVLKTFLLTPLREGRRKRQHASQRSC